MNAMRTSLMAMVLSLVATAPAFAATTTKVYNSGVLVLAFLGFCAMVVVAQMIPAIITLVGMVKGALGKKSEEAAERGR
jgi:hypothetical protein